MLGLLVAWDLELQGLIRVCVMNPAFLEVSLNGLLYLEALKPKPLNFNAFKASSTATDSILLGPPWYLQNIRAYRAGRWSHPHSVACSGFIHHLASKSYETRQEHFAPSSWIILAQVLIGKGSGYTLES